MEDSDGRSKLEDLGRRKPKMSIYV